MKSSTRIFLRTVCYSSALTAAVFSVLYFFTLGTGKPDTAVSSTVAKKEFEATENDKFNIMCTISESYDVPPHTYFLLGFNGEKKQISVVRLFPETLISDGEKNLRISDSFENGGYSAAARDTGEALGIDINRYIAFDRAAFLDLLSQLAPAVVDVPQALNDVDREKDIYIKIDGGRQVLSGTLLLDYICTAKWKSGKKQMLTEGAKAIKSLICENRDLSAVNSAGKVEKFILGNTKNNLSVADIENRRELLKYLLEENENTVFYLSADGDFEADGTAFRLKRATVSEIKAEF